MTRELGEVWRRVHEHVLLSAETNLIRLLQTFDRYVSEQVMLACHIRTCWDLV